MSAPTPIPAEARFVLTGPSGWIGQALCARLAEGMGGALGGRVRGFGTRARDLALPRGEVLPVRSLDAITAGDVAGAHVIHLGWPGKEQVELRGEAAFAQTHDAGDSALIAAMAAAARAGQAPVSLFFASSGAAALAERGEDTHPYGTGKLAAERRFLDWGVDAGVPVLAGRIFSLGGPFINKIDSYALASFARDALAGGPITVAAKVPVFRSFLHVNDLCDLVIAAALAGFSQPAPIDLCGAEVVEMADLARAVAAAVGGVAVRREAVDLSRPSVYLGDFTRTKVLAMALGVSLSGLEVQVAHTLKWLRWRQENANDSLAVAAGCDSKAAAGSNGATD